VVPEPNNRVTLRYVDASERTERLEGGVPPWSWEELRPLVSDCDALLVNFISGHEATLDTCRSLRNGFDGPVHADFHSLFLGMTPEGLRVPRSLPGFDAWLRCFDSVQLNEVEAGLAGSATEPTEAFAERVVRHGPEVCSVTVGARGVAWAALAASSVRHWRQGGGNGGRIDVGSVTIGAPREGDPTGCGDVWGAAFFARLLSGDSVPVAARVATRLAARNVEFRGAEGLHHVLAREVTP
jgi:sugar/nucleoside kinase (ribokinase family)